MVAYEWRGEFASSEVTMLHSDAFDGEARVRDWWHLASIHSLGWVTARDSGDLVGFVNVVWDGGDHAWLQDVMVDRSRRRTGIGKTMIGMCRDEVARAGCEWLHVDFEDGLLPFYLASGFAPSRAGLMHLRAEPRAPDAPIRHDCRPSAAAQDRCDHRS